MKNDKVLSLIGLATKAGRVVSGEFATEKEVKCGRAFLVVVALDASENTKKSFAICVNFMKCRCVFMEIKTCWGMRWEKNSARLWRCLMKDLQKV